MTSSYFDDTLSPQKWGPDDQAEALGMYSYAVLWQSL
jgi:hypothetical protein